MSITTKSLFHFTKNINVLKSILEYGFIPLYSNESESLSIIEWNKEKYSHYPMVCFCDIPLKHVKEHTTTYGPYGIGLSKEWGLKNNLNPVFYIEKGKFISNELTYSAMQLGKVVLEKPLIYNSFKVDLAKIFSGQEAVSCYLKLYQNETTNFYEEREWRFVMDPRDVEKKYRRYTSSNENIFKINQKGASEMNRSLKNNVKDIYDRRDTLLYDITDIRYLILPTERELHELIESVRKIKGGKKYQPYQIDILISKIVILENIENDF